MHMLQGYTIRPVYIVCADKANGKNGNGKKGNGKMGNR